MTTHPEPIPLPCRIDWSGHTDRGKVRKNNEDTFLGLAIDAREVRHLGKIGHSETNASDFVFAVSDGMGGAMAGEFASRIAIEKITKILPPTFRRGASGLSAGFRDVLQELFIETHKSLVYLGSCYEECAGMGATLSLAWFTPGWMYFGHIGDSRIYYFPPGGAPHQITHDDTYVGWLFRNGKINEREAKTHPRRSALQRALGAGNQFVEPQVGAVAYEPGDRFLLCTDGVVDGLYDAQFEELLAVGDGTAAQRVVTASVERSGRDNTTAVVVEIGSATAGTP